MGSGFMSHGFSAGLTSDVFHVLPFRNQVVLDRYDYRCSVLLLGKLVVLVLEHIM